VVLTISPSQSRAGVVRKIAEVALPNAFPGVSAYLAEVRCGKVRTDDAYQRPLDARHAAQVGQGGFNGLAAGLADVSFRNGSLWGFDGQHRLAHLAEAGVPTVQALLYEGLTQAQEAELFYLKNRVKKRVGSWTAFNAALLGGRKVEAEIMGVVRSSGLSTPLDSEAPDLTSTTILYEANADLPRLLAALKKGWGNKGRGLQPEAKALELQRGLLQFLRRSDLSDSAVASLLRKHPASAVNDRAARKARAKGKMRSDGEQVRRVLEGLRAVPAGR
jgi:hypothetical protein